jgi:hypothetical protein
MLRNLSRITIDSYLRLIRLPVDGFLAIGGDTGSVTAAKLLVDRADARTRQLAGVVLGDPDLQRDAELRREAAEEKARALNLRAEAELRSQRADQLANKQKRTAARQRKKAASVTKQRREEAQKRRQSTKAAAARRASQRRNHAKSSAAETEKLIEERAKHSRLEQLTTKTEAVQAKEAALVAADETRRVGRAAGAAKAKRKSDE